MAMFQALLHQQKDWQTLHLGMGREWQLLVGKDPCGHLTKVKVVAHEPLFPWYSCLGLRVALRQMVPRRNFRLSTAMRVPAKAD